MLLIGHLNAGVTKWSPSSLTVRNAKNFVCSLLKEKLNIYIDDASSQGGTSTTGNIARRCLTRKNDNENDFLYWILTTISTEKKCAIIKIHSYLWAILRVHNSGKRIDTEELSVICREIYVLILK